MDNTLDNHIPERITQSELARLLGVSRQAIHDLIRREILTIDDDGLMNVDEATAQIQKNLVRADAKTQANASELNVNVEPNTLHLARTQREIAEAGLKRLKFEEARNNLIDRSSYERAAMTTARILRDKLIETLPSTLAPQIAPLTDPLDCERLLRNHLRGALTEICALLDAEHDHAATH